MLESFKTTTSSADETQVLGERLGRALQAGDVVALRGPLGAGKTTLVQGIARKHATHPEQVKSPTFVLMREYPGDVPVVHVDAYRLEGGPEAAWGLDIDLIFSPRKITLIEWADRVGELLPPGTIFVELSHVSKEKRAITVSGEGARAAAILTELKRGQPPFLEKGASEKGARPLSEYVVGD